MVPASGRSLCLSLGLMEEVSKACRHVGPPHLSLMSTPPIHSLARKEKKLKKRNPNWYEGNYLNQHSLPVEPVGDLTSSCNWIEAVVVI